jgi:hypothetical protein
MSFIVWSGFCCICHFINSTRKYSGFEVSIRMTLSFGKSSSNTHSLSQSRMYKILICILILHHLSPIRNLAAHLSNAQCSAAQRLIANGLHAQRPVTGNYYVWYKKLTVSALPGQTHCWLFKAYWLRDTPTGLTFNNCMLCQHCICVFCIYLRTNCDLCHLQHKVIGFYNRDEKCLLHGKNWVFK